MRLKKSNEANPYLDDDGVPYCSTDECPMYDGKRCELLGHRPDGLCEPEVREIVFRLKQLEK